MRREEWFAAEFYSDFKLQSDFKTREARKIAGIFRASPYLRTVKIFQNLGLESEKLNKFFVEQKSNAEKARKIP